MPHFNQRQRYGIALFIQPAHGDVKPIGTQTRLVLLHFANNFSSGFFGMSNICTNPCGSTAGLRQHKGKGYHITAEFHGSSPWSGILD
jgi:hypothetical protein